MNNNLTLTSRIEKIAEKYGSFFTELFLYLPFDLVTIPVRDKMPRAIKKRIPAISCRKAYTYSFEKPVCFPYLKYNHKEFFKLFEWLYGCKIGENGICLKYHRNLYK